ncbi:MAG: cupin domain protein [Gammaproteobacteria bacterium]|nr:cupin domain protein [Gammaproteobacteria bacterium]
MHNELGKIYVRPWGTYQTLALQDGYQIKILNVSPQGRLSLQKHAKRSEHWIVTKGAPTLTVGDTSKIYTRGQYLYIPRDAVHRIENFTTEMCTLIEVQIGEYLGEDDIIRLEDIYQR